MKPFVHLHLHTQYSLLDGATKISKIFNACKERNFPAVAMTDHGNMYGAVKFVETAEKYNKNNPDFPVKPIIGCEFYVVEDMNIRQGLADRGHLILLAKTQEGYTNLVKLNSIAFIDGFYYKPRIDYKTLAKHSKGLICLTACLAGDVQSLLFKNFDDEAEKKAIELRDMFEPGDFYMELQNHGIEDQIKILPKQIELAKKIGIKCVVTNDVHYLNKSDTEMQDVMMCIYMQKKFDDPDRLKMPTDEFYMKTYDELYEKFSYIEEALDNTLEIAEKCNATVLFHQNLTPAFVAEDGLSPNERLRKLTWEGVNKRYKEITETVKKRVERELDVICNMGYSDYFLIVWDFVKYCEENDIPVGPGRGSAAGSVVSYALGITKIEPLRYDLFFERFLNPDRISMPDIDTDFCFERRGEVINYVANKYGHDKVCQIITFGTMAAKAAIKDVARTLNMPYSEVDKLTKAMPLAVGPYKDDAIRKMFGVEVTGDNVKLVIPELKKAYDESPLVRRVINLAIRLEGMPRNTSIHAAGVVICNQPIGEAVPLSKSGDDVTTQFDLHACEEVGILKMDFLGLRTLTDIKRTTDLIKKLYGVSIDFDSPDFSYNDPEVFKIIGEGNTATIFQLESGGMKRFMKELKPESMEEIIAGIALYRPGPMGMIPKYIECKRDNSKITYLHPSLEPILNTTYGVIIYQEQVMRIVQELAGYSLAQGDNVRKMMGKKIADAIKKERQVFLYGRDDPKHPIKGAVALGVSEEVANTLWDNMETFGQYGFNKSHSAGYAYIAYQTAYLKRYYEEEFLASVLNNRITNSDEIKKYIAHAKERNIKILPPDVNKSFGFFTIENKCIRYGLAAMKGVGIGVCDQIVDARKEKGPFKDLYDLISRLEGNALSKRFIESLILSGALDSFGKKRSQMMQVYAEIVEQVITDRKNKESGQISIFDKRKDLDFKQVHYPSIPEFNENIKLKQEKEVLGTYLSGHPLSRFAEKFKSFTLTGDMIAMEETDEEDINETEGEKAEFYGDLQDGMHVTCGGVITEIKKIFSKQGNREMAFVKIEDLAGSIEIVVFPNTVEKYKSRIVLDNLVEITGKLSIRNGESPAVLCEKIELLEKTEQPSQEELPVTLEQLAPKPKLYLKYSTLDDYKNTLIMNILAGHGGESEVIIKCTEKGNAFKASTKVDITDALILELHSQLDDNSIIIK